MSYRSYYPNPEQVANTNLDQDLKASRSGKYEKSEPEVKQWIFDILKIPTEEQAQYQQKQWDLLDILKDGELLCKLGNHLNLPNSPTKKYKNSRMPFIQMENISFFLQTCELINVPHDEIFQTVDLFERKDPYQIIITLISFSRKANEINPTNFPSLIGPKIIKVKPTVPRKPVALSQFKR